MATEQHAHDPGPAEFDRIVSRLRAEDSAFAAPKRFTPAVEPPVEPRIQPRIQPPDRPARGDGPFVLACLAVIVPMSMVVGGWIGLMAMFTSAVVAGQLALESLSDRQR